MGHISIPILYEDKDLIVINKPPGISVHGGERVVGPTVADFLRERFPELSSVGDDPALRPGIVHRLDKDTSGVMIIARNQEIFTTLKELFQKRHVEKTYEAIVCGTPRERQGIVSAPIGRLVGNPRKRGVAQGKIRIRGEREAITEYKVLKSGSSYSLVEFRPKTGRMHQIRVHARLLGCPVACDTLYGGEKVCCPEGCVQPTQGETCLQKRQLLHARTLSFSIFPGKRLVFEADPPEDFMFAVKQIL